MTIEKLIEDFRSVQEDAARDYPDARGACQILHKDLGLPATPIENAEERASERTAQLREAGLVDEDFELTADDLDFTVEHAKLHGLLRGYMYQSQRLGLTDDDIIALALLAGRRIGMKEAAESMTLDFDEWTGGDITGPDEWTGGDITGPESSEA